MPARPILPRQRSVSAARSVPATITRRSIACSRRSSVTGWTPSSRSRRWRRRRSAGSSTSSSSSSRSSSPTATSPSSSVPRRANGWPSAVTITSSARGRSLASFKSTSKSRSPRSCCSAGLPRAVSSWSRGSATSSTLPSAKVRRLRCQRSRNWSNSVSAAAGPVPGGTDTSRRKQTARRFPTLPASERVTVPSDLLSTKQRTIGVLKVFFAVAVLVPVLLFAVAAWQDRRVLFSEAEQRTVKTAAILQQQAMATLQIYELVFRQVDAFIAAKQHNPDPVELHVMLRGLDDDVQQTAAIFVVDRDGTATGHSLTPPPL